MNRGELRNLALVWLDDLNAGYFTVAQVDIWLNNAQRTMQKKLIKQAQNYYLLCKQTTLVIGQQDYVLPGDFKKLHRLEVVISGTGANEQRSPVVPMTLNQQDMTTLGPGVPGLYFFKKNRLSLWPIPNQTLTLRLYYTYEVADMVFDTDEPDAPESYHEYIAILAAKDGFIRDGRTSAQLDQKAAEFEAMINSDAQERNQDVPRGIVSTGANSSGYEDFYF